MSSRPLGLRRRDAHLVAIVAAVAALNVATTACYWFVTRNGLRASASAREELRAAIDEERERTSSIEDAVRVLVDAVARSSSSSSGDVPDAVSTPPRVQGVGRTKNARGEVLVYADVLSGGVVRRVYFRPNQGPMPSASGSVVSE